MYRWPLLSQIGRRLAHAYCPPHADVLPQSARHLRVLRQSRCGGICCSCGKTPQTTIEPDACAPFDSPNQVPRTSSEKMPLLPQSNDGAQAPASQDSTVDHLIDCRSQTCSVAWANLLLSTVAGASARSATARGRRRPCTHCRARQPAQSEQATDNARRDSGTRPRAAVTLCTSPNSANGPESSGYGSMVR